MDPFDQLPDPLVVSVLAAAPLRSRIAMHLVSKLEPARLIRM